MSLLNELQLNVVIKKTGPFILSNFFTTLLVSYTTVAIFDTDTQERALTERFYRHQL